MKICELLEIPKGMIFKDKERSKEISKISRFYFDVDTDIGPFILQPLF